MLSLPIFKVPGAAAAGEIAATIFTIGFTVLVGLVVMSEAFKDHSRGEYVTGLLVAILGPFAALIFGAWVMIVACCVALLVALVMLAKWLVKGSIVLWTTPKPDPEPNDTD